MKFPEVYLNDDGESTSYWRSSHIADVLEAAFPGQDAYNFQMACDYCDVVLEGMKPDQAFTRLVMLEEGCNDGPNWVWYVAQGDGYGDPAWIVQGGCDYTGWDCRANAEAIKIR